MKSAHFFESINFRLICSIFDETDPDDVVFPWVITQWGGRVVLYSTVQVYRTGYYLGEAG